MEPDWDILECHIKNHVAFWKSHLPAQQHSYKEPKWNAEKISQKAVAEAKTEYHQSENGECYSNPLSVSIKKAFKLMANDLDWGTIRDQIILSFNYIHDIEDIVNKAYMEAWQRWDPLKEPDFRKPGFALTKYIVDRHKRNSEREITIDFEDDIEDSSINASPINPLIGDELVKIIDNWLFDHYSWIAASVFILDKVYGVDETLCGILVSKEKKETKNAYRSYWYRIRKRIENQLFDYLKNQYGKK